MCALSAFQTSEAGRSDLEQADLWLGPPHGAFWAAWAWVRSALELWCGGETWDGPKRKQITDFRYTRPHWHVSHASGIQPVTRNIHCPWAFPLMAGAPFALLHRPWSTEAAVAASQVPWHAHRVRHSGACMSATQHYHSSSRAEHCNSAASLSWLIGTSPVLNEPWPIKRPPLSAAFSRRSRMHARSSRMNVVFDKLVWHSPLLWRWPTRRTKTPFIDLGPVET